MGNIKDDILKRIEELSKNCDWCVHQITGDNRVNKHDNSQTIQNWVSLLKDNEIRIDELQRFVKNNINTHEK